MSQFSTDALKILAVIITTRIYLPSGSGPNKSAAKYSHGWLVMAFYSTLLAMLAD